MKKRSDTFPVDNLHIGDRVILRCGAELEIGYLQGKTYDTFTYHIRCTSSEPVTWFYDGKYGYSGEHPFDVVGIKVKVKREDKPKKRKK